MLSHMSFLNVPAWETGTVTSEMEARTDPLRAFQSQVNTSDLNLNPAGNESEERALAFAIQEGTVRVCCCTGMAMLVPCVISCPPLGLDQLKALQKNYGRLQQDVLQFQKNQTNLERKFSYDLNQCISQMKEVKEQCEERIEEVTKKGNEAVASRDLSEQKDQSQQLRAPSEPQPRPQEAGLPQAEVPQARGNMPSNSEPQTPVPSSEAALDLKKQGEKEGTKEMQVASKEELQRDSLGLPKEPGREQNAEEDRRVGGKGHVEPGEVGHTPQVPAALLASQENQEMEGPERDQLVIPDGQEEEQEADEEGRNQQKLGADDDYNMDENEAESETDKQAALAGNDRNGNVLNAENQKGGKINLLEQREKRNHTL
ncbi:hypothetical protein E2I00_006891 [Balaenoptera physalus]|uniref:Golgi membrane protein 1 n=1 Tax=Balaenoptera physalus TaxID=9770 RepID=A0A643BMR2_BALPH|nr:hypothetical protein E2I00_006891 [Balaenoptera physalus]